MYCLPSGIGTLGAFPVRSFEQFRPPKQKRLQQYDVR
jgi:hypothetical protein